MILKITSVYKEVELKWAMLESRSSLNIISLLVLEVACTLGYNYEVLIEVSNFGGNCTYAIVNLDLTVGLMRAAQKFHVINSPTTGHLLIGRP